MPLIRTTLVIAVIFAFSPAREGVWSSAPAADPRGGAARERASAPATALSPAPARRAEPANQRPESIADLIAAASDDAGRARDLWAGLPDEAKAELARVIARELGNAAGGAISR